MDFLAARICAYSRRLRDKWLRLNLYLRSSVAQGEVHIDAKAELYVPVRCDGRGKVFVGKGTMVGSTCAPRSGNGEILLQARSKDAVIEVGENVWFSNNISLIANQGIRIGDSCLIGDFVSVMDSDFHAIDPVNRRSSVGKTSPVTIGNNVWFGSRVVVLKGVSIGDNSIISPQSVVTSDIPANCIASGNPAKVIRSI